MAKAVEAFRTISEVADLLEIPKHVLRFWEAKFPQVRPMKRGGGRRYYRPTDVELLRGIRHLLQAQGYTIKGAQKVLRDQGVDFVKAQGGDQTGEQKSAAVEATSVAEAATAPSRSTVKPGTERAAGRKAAAARRSSGAAKPLDNRQREKIMLVLQELDACRRILGVGVNVPVAEPGSSATAAKQT